MVRRGEFKAAVRNGLRVGEGGRLMGHAAARSEKMKFDGAQAWRAGEACTKPFFYQPDFAVFLLCTEQYMQTAD